MPTPDEDEFTELVDAHIPRVDLVDKAANGTRFVLIKQEDGQGAGLMSPEFVRDLIGKTAEPEPTREETVTMSGSPSAIAKLIHEAAGRQVTKAEMSTADQNDLPDSAFAYIESGGKKDESGKTVPRSLRHFPINDAAHVRNALSRAPQSPFGDKAMPAIRRAAKKFGIDEAKKMVGGDIDDGIDGMDPTVVLAAPDDDDAPGDPNDPGSPAWESIDAATAQKWLSIAYRVKNALGVMADRELLEAASADPDDADDAWDLQDAQCAMDYVIGVLANFAADEQAEAELGAEQMGAVGKALAGAAGPVGTIEALASVRKAGRSLSAQNEQAIRDAVASLQKVLASLPAAPVEKTANEESDMPEPTTADDETRASGQQPAMGSKEPKAVEKANSSGDDGKKEVVVVYDQKGRLVGIVDPTDITPVANAEAEPDDMSDDQDGDSDDSDDSSDDASDDTQNPDLEPQPAADAGTPADATGESDGVTKTEKTNATSDNEVLKSSILDVVKGILDDHSATQAAQIATTGDAVLELAGIVETLKGQVRALEEQPAEPRVFTNGAVPPANMLRGQDRGAPPVDVTKARELKQTLYKGTAAEQNRAAIDMQTAAIEALQAIHQRR